MSRSTMGTRERRQREFEEREIAFLECARSVIREEGLLNLQMSRIAEKCEYAVGTLYKHFESKEDLLVALALQDSRQHLELFERVANWQAGTRDKMFALGVADVIFVRMHPDYFRLTQYACCEAVWQAASPARREDVIEASQPLLNITRSIVHSAIANGDLLLPQDFVSDVVLGFWGLVTGIHSFVHAEGMLGPVSAPPGEIYRKMCRATQAFLNGYGWKPMQPSPFTEGGDALIQRIWEEVFHDLHPAL